MAMQPKSWHHVLNPKPIAGATAELKEFTMKILAILAIIAASFLPVLPAAAAATCSSDEINNQSSLSSTSEGGIACNEPS